MKHTTHSNVFHNTMLKGGFAAAVSGLVAIVAAFTAPLPLLNQYTGMGTMGMAALGVIFFYAAFLFSKGRWWAGLPSLFFTGAMTWIFAGKAVRLLMLYYEHNPAITFSDIIAPLPFISLQLVIVFITLSLGVVIFKAIKLSRSLSPQPVNKSLWGSMALWIVIIALDCLKKLP